MRQVRRRTLAAAVWIPLRAAEHLAKHGQYGRIGYLDDFHGVGTLAVPLQRRDDAATLDWSSIGIANANGGYVDGDTYVPSDIRPDVSGVYLALHQRGNQVDHAEWHLHQDFTITLGLKREKDVWVSLAEGYAEVVRLRRDERGAPQRLEVRASHLRDYLCARGMALRVVSYRHRTEVIENADHITWPNGEASEPTPTDRWVGRVLPIHEGGRPYGTELAVTHVARTDVDAAEDVPVLSSPEVAKTTSRFWTVKDTGRKLYRVDGELWRKEWLEPGALSERVRGDESPATVFFIVDAEGRTESREILEDAGRWLWFQPEVICALVKYRGGALNWHTRETGKVCCSPGDEVHFGINALGLVNAYAEEIAILPDWQQRIWAGFNTGPDGGLSEELYAACVKALPADTQAPEAFLSEELQRLADVASAKLGIEIVRRCQIADDIVRRAHRFRATNQEGLYALAKDLIRLIADSIDAKAIQTLVPPPNGVKWGSLKSLEKLLATKIEPEAAATLMSPLFGLYELRHADAHLLPEHEVEAALDKAGVNQGAPFVGQGFDLVHACVTVVCRIREVLNIVDG